MYVDQVKLKEEFVVSCASVRQESFNWAAFNQLLASLREHLIVEFKRVEFLREGGILNGILK